MQNLRVVTRRSDLALMQTALILTPLLGGSRKHKKIAIQIVPNDTFGDDEKYVEALGIEKAMVDTENKRKWIHELEVAVSTNVVDVAIHSAKDYPTEVRDGTDLLPILERDDPSDCFLALSGCSFADLPSGSVVGTKSKRRKAQILNLRPDLKVKDYVGNVMTRINRDNMQKHEVDAIVIAYAGINRLGALVTDSMRKDIHIFDPEIFIPNFNQGILLGQCRSNDAFSRDILNELQEDVTTDVWTAERSVVATMEADCRDALGVLAKTDDAGGMHVSAKAFSDDGKICVHQEIVGKRTDAQNLGVKLGKLMADEVRRAGIWLG